MIKDYFRNLERDLQAPVEVRRFGSGWFAGFFALPYTVLVYPLIFLPLLRIWSVSRVHGYVTPADCVQGRYGSRVLSLLIAITGIVATMPYIALQLVGLEAVLSTWIGVAPMKAIIFGMFGATGPASSTRLPGRATDWSAM